MCTLFLSTRKDEGGVDVQLLTCGMQAQTRTLSGEGFAVKQPLSWAVYSVCNPMSLFLQCAPNVIVVCHRPAVT